MEVEDKFDSAKTQISDRFSGDIVNYFFQAVIVPVEIAVVRPYIRTSFLVV